MKDPKRQNIVFDENGETEVRQQVLDSYYEGTNETNNQDNNDDQDQQ